MSKIKNKINNVKIEIKENTNDSLSYSIASEKNLHIARKINYIVLIISIFIIVFTKAIAVKSVWIVLVIFTIRSLVNIKKELKKRK